MAPIIPFLPMIISGVAGAVGSKVAGRKEPNVGKTGSAIDQLSGQLSSGGTQALGKAQGFFSNVLGGGEPLAEATGTGASDIGRQYQSVLSSVQRNAPRGGVATRFASELPYLQASDVQRLRLGTRMDVAKLLGQLGLGQTGQAMGGYEGLLRGALVSRAQNRDFYSQIGQDIGGLLGGMFTKKSGGGSGIRSPYEGEFAGGGLGPSSTTEQPS